MQGGVKLLGRRIELQPMPQVIAVCKSADLLLMVLDATKPWSHKEILTRELEAVGMRLNRDPPNIYFKKKKTGKCCLTRNRGCRTSSRMLLLRSYFRRDEHQQHLATDAS